MRVKRSMRGLILDEGWLNGLAAEDLTTTEASLPQSLADPNATPWVLLGAGTLVLVGIGYLLANA